MKTIQLTKGYAAVVDDADFERLSHFMWRVLDNPKKRTKYATTIIKVGPKRYRTVLMHRMILNAQSGRLVDHWDGDGLHNWRTNLRYCSNRQNAQNKRGDRETTSQFKGVHLMRNGKWRSSINTEEGKKHIGVFVRELDAATAYDAAARRCFGAFARTNFPEA
jgi:hypothetical protein